MDQAIKEKTTLRKIQDLVAAAPLVLVHSQGRPCTATSGWMIEGVVTEKAPDLHTAVARLHRKIFVADD